MSHASSPPSGPSSTPALSAWLGRGLLTGPGVTAGTGRLWLARGWPGGPGDVTCCLRLLSPAWDSQPASGRARAQRWVRQTSKNAAAESLFRTRVGTAPCSRPQVSAVLVARRTEARTPPGGHPRKAGLQEPRQLLGSRREAPHPVPPHPRTWAPDKPWSWKMRSPS